MIRQQQTGHVPPGQGKTSTHSRNARRKLKRQYDKQNKLIEKNRSNAVAETSANSVPLGDRRPRDDSDRSNGESQLWDSGVLGKNNGVGPTTGAFEVDEAFASTSLWNKNKKNGFKRVMSGKIPQKIIFDENGAEVRNYFS